MTNGSHGCINTPWEQAKIIFANISVGDPVICYSSASNQGKGTQNISQPAETRVLDKDGKDITDQQQSEAQQESDDVPVVDMGG